MKWSQYLGTSCWDIWISKDIRKKKSYTQVGKNQITCTEKKLSGFQMSPSLDSNAEGVFKVVGRQWQYYDWRSHVQRYCPLCTVATKRHCVLCTAHECSTQVPSRIRDILWLTNCHHNKETLKMVKL